MYSEYEKLCEGRSFPVFAVSKDGENIIIESGQDDTGDYFLVTSLRRNGWRVKQKVYKE